MRTPEEIEKDRREYIEKNPHSMTARLHAYEKGARKPDTNGFGDAASRLDERFSSANTAPGRPVWKCVDCGMTFLEDEVSVRTFYNGRTASCNVCKGRLLDVKSEIENKITGRGKSDRERYIEIRNWALFGLSCLPFTKTLITNALAGDNTMPLLGYILMVAGAVSFGPFKGMDRLSKVVMVFSSIILTLFVVPLIYLNIKNEAYMYDMAFAAAFLALIGPTMIFAITSVLVFGGTYWFNAVADKVAYAIYKTGRPMSDGSVAARRVAIFSLALAALVFFLAFHKADREQEEREAAAPLYSGRPQWEEVRKQGPGRVAALREITGYINWGVSRDEGGKNHTVYYENRDMFDGFVREAEHKRPDILNAILRPYASQTLDHMWARFETGFNKTLQTPGGLPEWVAEMKGSYYQLNAGFVTVQDVIDRGSHLQKRVLCDCIVYYPPFFGSQYRGKPFL